MPSSETPSSTDIVSAFEEAIQHVDDDMRKLAANLEGGRSAADKIDIAALRNHVTMVQQDLVKVARKRQDDVERCTDALQRQRLETETLRQELDAYKDKYSKLKKTYHDEKGQWKKDKDELKLLRSDPSANGVNKALVAALEQALCAEKEKLKTVEDEKERMSKDHATKFTTLKNVCAKYQAGLLDVKKKYEATVDALEALEDEAVKLKSEVRAVSLELARSEAARTAMRGRIKKYEDLLDSTKASITHVIKVRGAELEQTAWKTNDPHCGNGE